MHHVTSTGESQSFLGGSWKNKTADIALSMHEGAQAAQHTFWTLSGAAITYASLARTIHTTPTNLCEAAMAMY